MKDERHDTTSVSLAINDKKILKELSVGDEEEEEERDMIDDHDHDHQQRM